MKGVELLFHLVIVSIVAVTYGVLYHTALTVPSSHFSAYLPRVYKKLVHPPFKCSALPVSGFLAYNESNPNCQISATQFTTLCNVMGLQTDYQQRKRLFEILDVSGNGMLSWGELSVDYFKLGLTALQYYAYRMKFTNTFDRGLHRIDISYEEFKFFDYQPEQQ
jgi:hypothetical protein